MDELITLDQVDELNFEATQEDEQPISIGEGVAIFGGGGGTSDYTELENLPKINDIELVGNRTSEELGLADINYVDEKFNGANKAVSFVNYSAMISSLNALPNTSYNVGQNVMIVTLEVPDLWVSEIVETSIPYTYVSDNDFVSELNTNGSVQVGYYKLSALETQKVDLTNYVKNTDVAGNLQLGLIAGGENYYGFVVTPVSGLPRTVKWTLDQYKTKLNDYYFMGKGTLENIKDDYVKRGLTENAIELTNEEKASARDWLGAVGSEDIASQEKAGVVYLQSGVFGIGHNKSAGLYITQATEKDIDRKTNQYQPITAKVLDYAVKSSVTTNTIELTDEEKASAQSWLGIDQLITGALEAEY